jgi:hypothetical protein
MASNNDTWLRNHRVAAGISSTSAAMRGIKWAIGFAALRRAAGVFNNTETSGVDQDGAPARTAMKALHAPALFGANP